MESKHYQLLFAESNRKALSLAERLNLEGIAADCAESDPQNILARINRGHYDGIIFYHNMAVKYSEEIRWLKEQDNMPPFLLIRNYGPITDETANLIDAIINEPYNVDALCKTLDDLSARKKEPSKQQYKIILHRNITQILANLSISPIYVGYKYLREAIMMAILESDSVYGVTKIMYPKIAKDFCTTPVAVERGISSAIMHNWNDSEITTRINYFGANAMKRDWKPTNRAFIMTVADYIKCQLLYSNYNIN